MLVLHAFERQLTCGDCWFYSYACM